AVMVTHGAIAGGMSPLGPGGVIVATLFRDRLGLTGAEWAVYLHNLLANTAVAFAGFLLFGGLRRVPAVGAEHDEREPDAGPVRGRHRATLAVLGLVVVVIVGFGADVGMAAFAGSVALIGLRLADEQRAIRSMPWGVIVMVCGVSVLAALLEQTGGADRLAELVARVATPHTAPPMMALLCGLV